MTTAIFWLTGPTNQSRPIANLLTSMFLVRFGWNLVLGKKQHRMSLKTTAHWWWWRHRRSRQRRRWPSSSSTGLYDFFPTAIAAFTGTKTRRCRASGPFFSNSSCNFWWKIPSFTEKKIWGIFFPLYQTFQPFFPFFLQQPPPPSKYFNFAASRSSPRSINWFIMLPRDIKHSNYVGKRVTSIQRGQNMNTNMGPLRNREYRN